MVQAGWSMVFLCSEIPHCGRTRAPRDPLPQGTVGSAEGQSAAYVTIPTLQLKPYNNNKKQLSQTILSSKPRHTPLFVGVAIVTTYLSSFLSSSFVVSPYPSSHWFPSLFLICASSIFFIFLNIFMRCLFFFCLCFLIFIMDLVYF